ncbi:MAG: T9SS type A sorting domain-containing protein, partial [Adhaeribacter sp.]
NVKTIAGAGNSSQTLHYTSTDEYPLPGVSYYRLAQVDFDGTTSYSKVVAVKQHKSFSDDPFIIGARPNPFHSKTEVQFRLPAETPVSITVTDALGKVIATDKMAGRAGKNVYTLKGDHLANGIYFFTLNTGSESSSFKLVKNR